MSGRCSLIHRVAPSCSVRTWRLLGAHCNVDCRASCDTGTRHNLRSDRRCRCRVEPKLQLQLRALSLAQHQHSSVGMRWITWVGAVHELLRANALADLHRIFVAVCSMSRRQRPLRQAALPLASARRNRPFVFYSYLSGRPRTQKQIERVSKCIFFRKTPY